MTPGSFLSPEWNHIPPAPLHIHLIAVCGAGMGALAGLLHSRGCRVTGSDAGVYPPMSEFLAERGIAVTRGFSGENLIPRPDLVIVGNAVRRDNPEALALAGARIPYCSMPQAVNHFMGDGRDICLVTGTHGKTTTSSLLSVVLDQAGRSPSFFIGGIVRDFGTNCRMGSGPELVVEGDEYDTAFFDKGPKFLHYTPRVCVITGIEFDHGDIYRDISHIESVFARLLERIPGDSLCVIGSDTPSARRLAAAARCRVEWFGDRPEDDWRADKITAGNGRTRFGIWHKNDLYGRFETGLMGRHNLMNVLACAAAAHDLGASPEAVCAALSDFQGVRRRQEIRGRENGVTVMDDFAHHPTAVRETIRAVRPSVPDGRLLAVFEPRTNTSMRNIFQDAYAAALSEADAVYLRVPNRIRRIPEGERFSVDRLAADLGDGGTGARCFPDTDGIVRAVTEAARPGDLVLVMSNGGFDDIHRKLLAGLREKAGTGIRCQTW
ncbi:MAG: UDP-N-acetylmuramate:L-alanyl-gamma-D-glutamyl-meso-diaminopimelate ligase [Desulfobacterales bacterium]|nr:MAG: UDP-N-acetylmuramate:L-alanyl-gamma-D-glutamyl-meso-diaminopimelate ligase [Desulfobacterales bacterium]